MAKESKLVAESRSTKGSANARRLRRQGHLPGVINVEGGGTRLLQFNLHDFSMMLRHHSSENLLFDMVIDNGAPCKVLLKDVQRDPVDNSLVHLDFIEISMTKKMRVRIPLVLVGEAHGVLQEGGVMEQILRELEVECLPGDLVETLDVDVTALKLNELILVSQLTIDKTKYTVLTAAHLAVAGVMEQKEEEVAAEAEAVVGEPGAAGPEVITKGKKEEEGEGGEGAAPKEKGKAEGKEAAGKAGGKAEGKAEAKPKEGAKKEKKADK